MSTPEKDTIYLDVEEEITGIISKVGSSPKKIVALVLPRRASVLQSIVNMKLLKRSADQAEKNLVLITSEAGLLPLAGAAGIHVASSLTAKPYLPPSPIANKPTEAVVESAIVPDPEIDPTTPVGDLVSTEEDSGETIQIDNSAPAAGAAGAAAGAKAAKGSGNKGKKKLSVPNFNRFRKKLILGAVALILLIIALFWAFAIAPKATITIKTESNEVELALNFTADTSATEVKMDEKTLPAEKKDLPKTDTEKVAATGQKNKGTTATGSVTMTAKKCSGNPFEPPAGIAAGTGISTNGVTFITQSNATFTGNGVDGSGCYTYLSSNLQIAAQEQGAKYNVGNPSSFSVAGRSDVSATGTASGGSDNIVKVVTQQDIDSAKQKIADKQKTAKDVLKAQFAKTDSVPLLDTFTAPTPVINVTPAVDSEANEVTVTSASTYTMLGVKKSDLKKFVKEELKENDETKDQNILSEGIDTATFTVSAKPADGVATIAMQTKVVVGPDLKQDEIKQELAGKKHGEAESLLSERPGVTEARVSTKPFWNNKVPGKPAKVTIIIQQANGDEIKP